MNLGNLHETIAWKSIDLQIDVAVKMLEALLQSDVVDPKMMLGIIEKLEGMGIVAVPTPAKKLIGRSAKVAGKIKPRIIAAMHQAVDEFRRRRREKKRKKPWVTWGQILQGDRPKAMR